MFLGLLLLGVSCSAREPASDTARETASDTALSIEEQLQLQEIADKKFEEWFKNKEKQNQETLNKLAEANKRLAKTKFEAEKKVNETRAATIMKRKQDAEAALVAEITEVEVTAKEKNINDEAEETIPKPKGPEKVKEVKEEKTKKAEEVNAEEAKAEEVKAEEVKVDKTQENNKGAESPKETSK